MWAQRPRFDAGMYTHTQTFNTTTAGERQRNSEINPAKERATPIWKEKQALSSGWFSEPPDGLLSSVPDGVAGQKGHFVEILPEWLRWLSINKREDFVNVPDVFRGNEATWSNFKTSRITGESIIQNVRNKVSIFLSLAIVNFLDVIFKWHCQLN